MDMETKIDQILKIVTMTQQDLATLKRDFQELKEQDVAELKERVGKLEENVKILQKDVAELKERVTKLEERVTSLERSVMLIEVQHGDKLSALFVSMEANKDEHKKLENLCLSIKSEIQGILLSHEKRISKLEGNLVPSF